MGAHTLFYQPVRHQPQALLSQRAFGRGAQPEADAVIQFFRHPLLGMQRHPHVRVFVHEGFHHAGKPAAHQGFMAAQLQPAADLLFQFIQGFPPPGGQLKNVVAVSIEHPPRVVRYNLSGLAQQQRLTHCLLQLANPAAEGRFRATEIPGTGGQAAGTNYRDKGFQLFKVVHRVFHILQQTVPV